MAYVVHCSDPLDPAGADRAFAAEAGAAGAAGLASLLVDHDALASGDMRGAMRRARPPGPGAAVYRGWMMRAEAYGRLHGALAALGVGLMTSPGEYAACHHYPEAHAAIGRFMPPSAFVDAALMDDPGALRSALSAFGGSPVTVKDWVKSQAAGYWDTACLVPDASDPAGVARVTARFRELQGTDLVGGLVFRRLLDLRRAPGGVEEWRAFSVDGAPAGCWPRFAPDGRPGPPAGLLREVAAALPSPFASFDLSPDAGGRWWVMEAGDGQVSGFPVGSGGVVIAALARRLSPAAPAPHGPPDAGPGGPRAR